MPVSDTPLLREAISNGLVEHGFRRLPHGGHTRPIRPDWCVVVDTGPRIRTAAAASVYVGLHHHRVEQLVTELLQLPHRPEEGVTVSSHLGHFFAEDLPPTPGEKPGSIIRAAPGRVIELIEAQAHRLQAISNLDDLLTAYGTPNPSFPDFKYAAINLLRGDLAAVAAWLVDLESSQCQSDGPICDQYRRFRSNAIAFGGAGLERHVELAEAARAAQPSPKPPRDPSKTLVGRLVSRLRAVAEANPDFANHPRDIPGAD